MRASRAFLSFLLLLFACGALAQAQPGGVQAVQRLLRDRPKDPALWFYLARFDAEAADAKGCVAALDRVEALGDGFLPARELGFAKVWDDPAFQAVRARLEARLPRLDYAPTAIELPDRGLLPEGIAYDSHARLFFIGSVAEHRILRVTDAQEVSEFAGASAGLDSVLGLTVDGPRRRLYAVSTTAVAHPASTPRRNAIFAFDLVTGRLLRRIEVPQAKQLNDVAVAPGGRVYASDSESGAVFEIPEHGEPRAVVPPGALRGSNGIAASPDARRLYVATSTGLAVVDLVGGSVKPMPAPPRDNLAAIDGLYQWQGSLIGVENTTNPGRVVLVTLSRDGESVTGVQTLLSHHHPALAEPTTGAVGTKNFYLLAATGLGHLRPDGRIDDPDAVPRPLVLRLPLPR